MTSHIWQPTHVSITDNLEVGFTFLLSLSSFSVPSFAIMLIAYTDFRGQMNS